MRAMVAGVGWRRRVAPGQAGVGVEGVTWDRG